MIAGHKLAAEARGYVDGPHAGFLPRRLALFSPVTRAGLQRSAHFPNSNPCLGRPPSTCTARHGVERSLGLRHAASHSRRVGFASRRARQGVERPQTLRPAGQFD